MSDCKVVIHQGRNAWLLARTDRDAPDAETVAQTAGAFLSKVLGPASPTASRSGLQVLQSPIRSPGFTARFVIGAARPVVVRPFREDNPTAPLEPDGVTQRHTDCESPLAVKAQTPWFVLVGFDWRAPSVAVEWPKRAVNFIGLPTETNLENDWLLLSAAFQGSEMVPDTSLMGEFEIAVKHAGKQAVVKVEEAAGEFREQIDKFRSHIMVGAVLAGLAGAAYLAHRYKPRRRRD